MPDFGERASPIVIGFVKPIAAERREYHANDDMDIAVDSLGSAVFGRLCRYVRHSLRTTATWPSSGAHSPDSQPAAARRSADHESVVQPDVPDRHTDAAAVISENIKDDAEPNARRPAQQYDTSPAPWV